ncbi:MAG TPA: sigma 54-interacting transcriptional regulator [Blastocatellia bacterium]|nr:sigma 54-interacting transcriptional regulator [Blastocatellia bacterium]
MASRDVARNLSSEDALAAGQAALEESRFEDAANYLRSALRAGARSAEEEVLIRTLLSEAFEKRSLYREQIDAVAKYEKLAEFSRLSERNKMLVLVRLGWGYSFSNDLPRAIALFNQAMKIARGLEDHAGIGACYFGLGRAYRQLSEIRIARDHYASALEHYRHTGDWRKLAESYLFIGYINAYEGDYRNSLQSLKQTLAIIGDRDEHDLLGRAHMYLAITYDNLGSTSKALDSWDKCLDHFHKAGNLVHLAINQNNLADKLIWLGEWDRAEELTGRAIEVLKESTFPAQYGTTIDTLARLQLHKGNIEEADRLLEESLNIFRAAKTGEWIEVSTLVTIGLSCLEKGQIEEAKQPLTRAVDICMRGGGLRYASEARLLLADAMLLSGHLEEAREIAEAVRVYLRDAPSMLSWGLMMRTLAKVEAADGHIAAAVQSLGQSTSIYDLRGNVFECAVNRIFLAELLERQGDIPSAIDETESALQVFERLGAALNERTARTYLASLRSADARSQGSTAAQPVRAATVRSNPDLASCLDGFTAQRLVQAAVSRDLLLHELAAIVRDQALSRAVLVAELLSDDVTADRVKLKVAASLGLDDRGQSQELEFLSELPAAEYRKNHVYRLADNQQLNFLLHIIEPHAERFRSGAVNLRPVLYLVEQGLETYTLKMKTRRTQVFDPARVLSQVELPGFVCASRAMTSVIEQIHKIRSSDVTVLITGESGTGKELVARAVHASSSRRLNVFLPFNCSAAPHEMIESQLFGFRKGAFTGAVANSEGIIRSAERGTLFLDEIGDLPLTLQPKLLRFLQEGEIHPIGESQPLKVDVRAVAATNSDLERGVTEGRFREDLFHRLNVIRIQVPPLRQRREEIPALINHYLHQYQQDSAKNEIRLSEEAVDLMVVYDWPGNVRQLCNEVRRVVAYTESGTVATPDGLSAEIIRASREIDPVPINAPKPTASRGEASTATVLSEAVEELERRMIQEALRRSSGNIARASKELGLSRKGLYLKMDRLNFNV